MTRRYIAIVASYNCMDWLPKCLVSLDAQELPLDVCIIDDASTDPDQADFIDAMAVRHGWEALFNDTNRGPLYNQVRAINHMNPSDGDVIVFVDGDDRLAHPNVLNVLERHYNNDNLMTYGSYESVPFSPTCHAARWYPVECRRRNDYRNAYKWGVQFNHLRTIDYKLFRHLDETDFTFPNGEWFTAGGDTAIMIPCLEMSGKRHQFIRDTLYYYNSENSISEWRVHTDKIEAAHTRIFRQLKKKDVL